MPRLDALLIRAGFALSLVAAPFFSLPSLAQSRIRGAIDDTQRVTLYGSVHPLARSQYDRGAVPGNLATGRMMLLLGRSAEQETTLQAFLRAVQDPGSPQYHQYLTPQQFGQQYGISDGDLQAVTGWLRSEGFAVARVASGRGVIEFSGTAGQVQAAFQTVIHSYAVNGEQRYANASEPAIPAALAAVITGVTLNNFSPHPLHEDRGQATLDPVTHRAMPLYNAPSAVFNDCLSGYCFGVTPGDFAAIYDTKPLLAAGIDGTGVTIGVIATSSIDTSLVQQFRENFLPAYSSTNLPNVIIDGPDTMEQGGEMEAYADVEVASGVAPNATINLYVAGISYVSNGVDLALTRAIDDNQVSVLSVSFGLCEAFIGTTYNQFYNNMYEQAAAQGITVVAATGDTGSASCDPPYNTSGPTYAVSGLFVSGLASTPYNIAVGGTDFYYPAKATLATLGAYWNTASAGNPNNNADWSSAKGYIPEKAWNISNPALNQVNEGLSLGAGGGGASNCVVSTVTDPTTFSPGDCESGYAKPAWQSGFGGDSARDLPDVALFASSSGNYGFTVVCTFTGDCPVANSGPNSVTAPMQITRIGGTSVAAPAMAGIMALVAQKTQARQGQANAILYPLSVKVPQAFHDIAVGGNAVDCTAGTRDCASNGYLPGYNATAGYDQATGLGSIDAAVLVNNWSQVALKPTTTTLSIVPTTATHGTTLTFTVNVTGGPASGNVAILTTAAGASAQGLLTTTCAAFPCIFTSSELPGGSYNVFARYPGDSTYAPSISAAVAVTIGPENSQIGVYYEVGDTEAGGHVAQVMNLNGQTALLYGGIITFTAVSVPASGPLPANPLMLTTTPATGTITVSDNGSAIGAPLVIDSTGKANFVDYDLAVGSHSLVATYSGDKSYNPSSTVSPLATPLNFTIVPTATTLTLGRQYASVVPGYGDTVYATLMPVTVGPAQPTGTITVSVTTPAGMTTVLTGPVVFDAVIGQSGVTIAVPASALGVVPMTASSALQANNNVVTASYSGDNNYLPSTQVTPVWIYDAQVATQVKLAVAPLAPVVGQPVTISVTVPRASVVPLPGFPTGTVTLLDGATMLGVINTVADGQGDGVGSFTTSSLAVGTYTVTANYSGDPGDLPSSGTITFSVGAPSVDFTIAATPVALAGGLVDPSGNSTLTLTLNYPFASASVVDLRCAPPAGVSTISCSVPASVTFAAGATTASATMMISLAGTTAKLEPARGWGMMATGFALALLLPFGVRVRRGRRAWLSLLALFALATGLSACGSAVSRISHTVSSGNYSVTVTGSLGGLYHEATAPVVVQ